MHTIFAILVVTCSLATVKSYAVRSNDNNADVLSQLYTCRGKNNLKQCIKDTLESLRPYLANGIPDLNLPGCEPYHIKRYEFDLKHRFNGTATFKDIIIYGLTNFTINNVESTFDMRKIKFEVYFPHIQVYAFYDIIGEVYHIPIKYGNNMTEDFLDITSHIIIKGVYDENSNNLEYELQDYRIAVNLNVKDDNRESRRNKRLIPEQWDKFLTYLFTGWFAPEILNKVERDASNINRRNSKHVVSHPMSQIVRY
ncbi:uncharacterized protein LOC116848924 [Odontomachus brunneus]|uniref:uncharacterized protein LOC116848924 n=1 Tax=Odontomachus brunneus TaxID=486640 RepID=UPI0013F28875|nr:uncharacterized protein LOC116848924 [Odontomachus brunneus]